MSGDKLRQQILFEAARLMHQRQEQEYARAKQRAARTLMPPAATPLPAAHQPRDPRRTRAIVERLCGRLAAV